MPKPSIRPYKPAKVYIGKNEWYVEFYWWSKKEQRYKREKIRGHGSRGLSEKERRTELQDLADQFNAVIKQRNRDFQYHPEGEGETIRKTLLSWIDDFVMRTDWRGKEPIPATTKTNFRMTKSHLLKFYAKHPEFNNSLPIDVNVDFVREFKVYLKESKHHGKSLTGKTINMYLWGLKNVLEKIKSEGVAIDIPEIEQYRARQVKNESDKYPPLTHEEKERAFNFYREHLPDYYLFLLFIYYSSIRPAELHRLQADLFDFENDTIHVWWMDTKNGLSNFVQMLAPLKKALLDAGVDKLPKKHYLFGKSCMPSAKPWTGKADMTGDIWAKYREHLGIPKNKKQYGLKHTFNKDYIEQNKNNVNWEWLRRHNRHATKEQTQEYISELTAYFIDETDAKFIDYHG